jgi:hypothetical protein
MMLVAMIRPIASQKDRKIRRNRVFMAPLRSAR